MVFLKRVFEFRTRNLELSKMGFKNLTKKVRLVKMSKVDGVIFEEKSDCYVCSINELSDGLKIIIRKRLSAICHGKSRSDNESEFYNYKRTLVQFNERIEKKDSRTKKGMIGELLLHILIIELIEKFKVISPFFNLEEKSIKKGFDIILADSNTMEIWIVESKSGEIDIANKTVDSKNSSLLATAKSDLESRLNEQSTQRWQSALNGLVFTTNQDNKLKLIKKILENEFKKAETKSAAASNHNVILASSVFSTTADRINIDNVIKLKVNFNDKKTFKKVILLSIQKNTYQKVIDFFKDEIVSV